MAPQETNLYYLQSRYYDPKVGRFLNADIYTTTGQGFVGNNMFAYCGNNPANYCDYTGCKPEYNGDPAYEWAWDLGWWVKEQLEDWKEKDEECIKNGQVTYQSKGTNNGATIYNSYKISNPDVMRNYIKENRSDDIKGSTSGVVYEWVFHNIAYVAFDTLGIDSLKDSAQDLDVGKTLFADHRKGFTAVFSAGMKASYLYLNPINAIIDLFYELE